MADENVYDQNLTLDEIVFENRNKEYGAYDLRHQYPRLLTNLLSLEQHYSLLQLCLRSFILRLRTYCSA
jgi:hypothetical protein